MAIFISYNQKDRAFVDVLAANLVAAKHNVWMDRWELSLGDSLTQKIEGALTKANAILVILSKNSVQSEWCKRELSAGLIRELEEKQTLVMPCVIDDCEIPIFLRDKLYADFRRDPDQAFHLVDSSLARFSNPLQGRAEQPHFHTDWAIDWRRIDGSGGKGNMIVQWTFIDHGNDFPYVILSECAVHCDEVATNEIVRAQKRGEHASALRSVLKEVIGSVGDKPLSELITDQFPKFVAWRYSPGQGRRHLVIFSYRRLGIDNGMDTLVHLDNNLHLALEQMDDKLFDPKLDRKASSNLKPNLHPKKRSDKKAKRKRKK